jgi:D-alanine-D-alanine ligase
MRLLVLHNAMVLPESHPESASERGNLPAVRAVAAELAGAGFQVECLEVGHDLSVLVEALRSRRPDAVVNLYERMLDEPHSEARVATILERSGVAFTGSPATALRAGRDKDRTKRLARRAQIDVPDGLILSDLPAVESLDRWPLIVKPALRDSSQGIDDGSVVQTDDQLNDRVALLLAEYGAPVLVEEYIAGREFQLHIIETPKLVVLPPTEVHFDGDTWPIVTYDRKWSGGPGLTHSTAELSSELALRLALLAERAFDAVGCRDYATVDVRLRSDGRMVLLEVNPNPDLGPDGGLAKALAAAGMDYGEFLIKLARGSAQRMVLGATG